MQRNERKPVGYVDFRAVRGAVSIEAVLARYGLLERLTPKEDGYTGDCPFHEGESRRALHVSLSKNAWYCFGCEEGGNVLDFVGRMEDVSIKRAAQLLAEWFEVPTGAPPAERESRQQRRAKPEPQRTENEPKRLGQVLEEAVGAAPPSDKDGDGNESEAPRVGNKPLGFALKHLDPAHDALRPLGFDPALVERFEAGYCDRGMMKGRLAVPIHSPTGELLAYAGVALDGDGEIRYPPNFDRTLEVYNLHRAAETAETRGLILAPGLLDVWRLAVAGFDNAVTLASDELSARQEELLLQFAGETRRILVLSKTSAATGDPTLRLLRKVYIQAMELDVLLD